MQQQVFTDFDQLVAAVDKGCAEQQPCLVLVDGFLNSGKSKLAGRLSTALGAVHVELDDFLNKHQIAYVAQIRYAELTETLSNITSTSQPVVIEGVCAQEVLNRVELAHTTSVYVKRLVASSWWDGSILGEARSLAEAMATDEGKTGITSELDEEVFEYHFRFRPHERSAFVYTWES